MGTPTDWRPPPEGRQWKYESERRLALKVSGSRRLRSEHIVDGGPSRRPDEVGRELDPRGPGRTVQSSPTIARDRWSRRLGHRAGRGPHRRAARPGTRRATGPDLRPHGAAQLAGRPV